MRSPPSSKLPVEKKVRQERRTRAACSARDARHRTRVVNQEDRVEEGKLDDVHRDLFVDFPGRDNLVNGAALLKRRRSAFISRAQVTGRFDRPERCAGRWGRGTQAGKKRRASAPRRNPGGPVRPFAGQEPGQAQPGWWEELPAAGPEAAGCTGRKGERQQEHRTTGRPAAAGAAGRTGPAAAEADHTAAGPAGRKRRSLGAGRRERRTGCKLAAHSVSSRR